MRLVVGFRPWCAPQVDKGRFLCLLYLSLRPLNNEEGITDEISDDEAICFETRHRNVKCKLR